VARRAWPQGRPAFEERTLTGAGLTLSPAAAALVERGGRDIPLPLVEAGAALERGGPVRLARASGDPIGLGLIDRENALLRVMVGPGEPFRDLDSAFLAARVEAALGARRTLGLASPDAAYRLLNGAGDQLPGLLVDVFGRWAVVHSLGGDLLPLARDLADVVIGSADLHGVVVKRRSRGAAARGELLQEIRGVPPPGRLNVTEGDLRFEVHLLGGLNVGLFTDMREERRAIAALAKGRSVLNGFSYTGTLSVASARGGAAHVASVDLSAGVQRWARDNFRLNGLVPRDPIFRFPVSDVGRFLDSAASEGRRYDLVLLDPPAFSSARGAPFTVDRDYPALVAKACALLPPGGVVWLACNARGSSLDEIARLGFERAGRRATLLARRGLPPDHPTLDAQPQDHYLQVAVCALE
jgi:23S rRNA (cytosine1962-C5)-methyltransferase